MPICKQDNMKNNLIDPRQPRFFAFMSMLLAISMIALIASGNVTAGLIFNVILAISFIWSLKGNPRIHPFNIIFSKLIEPNLSEPKYLEDSRGPRFAQKIGLVLVLMSGIALLLNIHLSISIAVIFVLASGLNAFLEICLGCMLYLRFKKYGINI